MTFTLHVDGDRWRKHLEETVRAHSKIGVRVAPVIKGNGYGFGRSILSREAARIGIDTIAVGTVYELDQALAEFPGTCVVLEPFQPADVRAAAVWQRVLRIHADRVVATVAGPHLQEAAAVGATRVRLEAATSLGRFGMPPHDIDAVLRGPSRTLSIEGIVIHLPISEPEAGHVALLETPGDAARASGWLRETLGHVIDWSMAAADHRLPLFTSVSHLGPEDLALLRELAPDVTIEARIGTSLWLGDHDALTVTGTVLAVHEAGYGHTRVGYTQVDSHGHRRVLVVSGGTTHGVALSAPVSPTTVRRRAVAVAQGLTEAMGKVRSPFSIGRHRLAFAEPPHMHVSMLWCEDLDVAVGDEISCRVRHTTANFDAVTGLD